MIAMPSDLTYSSIHSVIRNVALEKDESSKSSRSSNNKEESSNEITDWLAISVPPFSLSLPPPFPIIGLSLSSDVKNST